MKTKLITKFCLTEFYFSMVNFMNLIFSKKYGTLYNLFENLVTKKATVKQCKC